VAAYGSSYRSDLLPLLADLPAAQPRSLRAGWAQGAADNRQAGVGISGTGARDTTKLIPVGATNRP
jgi:hypothetical protein